MRKTVSFYKGNGDFYISKGICDELQLQEYNKVSAAVTSMELSLHFFRSSDMCIPGAVDMRPHRVRKGGIAFPDELTVDKVRKLIFRGSAQEEAVTMRIKKHELHQDRKSITLFFGIGETVFTKKQRPIEEQDDRNPERGYEIAISEIKKQLTRRLNRNRKKAEELSEEHSGKERQYTYHGGYSLGYHQGKVCELEDFIDDLDDLLKCQLKN